MPLRNILLYLDDHPACEARIDAAFALGGEHGAQVTGLSITAHDYYQPRQRQNENWLAGTEELFRKKAADAGVAAIWRAVDSPVVGVGAKELLISHAHCTGLVIVGQEEGGKGRRPAMAERLVLGSGRPVLVVPAAGRFPSVGRHVLVAWKNGREAARALNDAMPILMKAQRVTLLAVAGDGLACDGPWDGILGHLRLHGVDADAKQLPATSAPLADTLLNHASDGGFDLLVMGAFGTTPQGGARLGPVAAQILREMTLPVLMAH